MSVQYLPGEGAVSTVSYSAEAYRTLGYNKGGEYVLTDSEVLMQGAEIEYSVEGETGTAENITINSNGLLEIQSDAAPGIYTVTAACGELSDSVQLEVRAAGEAASAQVSGVDEIVLGSGSEYSYNMIPIAETGAILPDKETLWSIEGESKGCSISENGVLRIGDQSGKITIKGTFTENNLSSKLDVYIRTEDEIASAPVNIEGFMLSSGKTEISGAAITEFAISSSADVENANVIIKAYDKNNVIIMESEQNIGRIEAAAYSVELPEAAELGEAVGVRMMILDADGNVISKKTETKEQGIYKGIPIVSDWYTNPEVGTGTNVNSSAPAGVDPDVVDTTKSNAKYTYDQDYPDITKDNLLWYKTGAYFSTSNIYEQHSRDWEQQALPIGNGYMGGMIYGMPGKDHMQFNEETFWLGGYRGFQSEVASNKINTEMGEGPNSYVNAGNLFVDFGLPSGAEVSNYYRDLDLDEAVSHVSYTYDGVKYSREYFASYPAQSIVMRYTADKSGSLSFDVIPVMAHPGDITTKDGIITIVGKIKDSEPYYGGGQVSKGIESDLEYCAKVKVVADGGKVIDEYGKVSVAGADSVTIILTCATDYDPDRFEIREDGTVDVAAKQYKHIMDTKNKIGDIYVTDPATGTEYVHEGRFTPYISKITSLTDIGIVSNQGYSIALANLRVYETVPNKLTIGTPKERQIMQRNDENRAMVNVSGTYRSEDIPDSVEICAELAENARRGKSVDWQSVDSFADGEFSGTLELMAGGWYTVKVRVKSGGAYMEEEISRVGVGDIYLTAGQSNSASFGQDKTTPSNDTVSTWDPDTGAWVFSSDPQVSWSGSFVGTGGSPWPTLGDYLTEKYGVPIGFISAGWGSSVVADFLPENNKHYKRIRIPLEEFGVNGIKAVLWHQGESDAINGTSSEQYKKDLLTVIESSRSDAGYDIPWVIARAAYHTQSSAEAEQRVVAGQVSACNDINIFVGPTTDDLLDGYRSTTDHVHFRKAGLIEHGTRWGKALDAALYHGTEDIYIGNVYTDQTDKGYEISFKLNNTGSDTAEYTAYMAVYESGVLSDVSAMGSGAVEADSFADINGVIDIPQDSDGFDVKLFIWTGEDTPVTLPIKLV